MAEPESLRSEYVELCRSYHAIDDFRAKLLALLPIASWTGIFVLLTRSGNNSHVAAIAVFGFMTTLGLSFYELYGIQKCRALIDQGKRLEATLELEGRQFSKRPPRLLGFIAEEAAAYVIYGSTLFAWGYVAGRGFSWWGGS